MSWENPTAFELGQMNAEEEWEDEQRARHASRRLTAENRRLQRQIASLRRLVEQATQVGVNSR